jgi:AraC family transcriptional regulator
MKLCVNHTGRTDEAFGITSIFVLSGRSLNTVVVRLSWEIRSMSSSVLLKLEQCRPAPLSADAPAEHTLTSRQTETCSLPDQNTQVSIEAVKILDDVRRAILWSPERARAAALELVGVLTQPADEEPEIARGGLAPWQRRKVDRYLADHLNQRLCTKDVATQISLSVSHFYRAFKESYGTTPHIHLMTLRLQYAQRLMLATDYPLSQIALVCGMADQSHLSKLFRRGLGDTPNAWRRRNLSDAQAEAGTGHFRTSQRETRQGGAGLAQHQDISQGALSA